MKSQIKSIGLSAIVFMINGVLNNVSAHDILNSLGTSASATDWFTINCPAGTAEFYAHIIDTSTADGVFFKVIISKNGALASDDKPESGAPSLGVILVNGAGIYNIFVTHSGATNTAKNYTIIDHCQTAAHVNTATQPNPIVKQNQ